MSAARESWITVVLCGACAVLAAAQLWPRLVVGRAEVDVVSPDVRIAVEGAVAAPGTYTLAFGASVADAVAAAGGMTRDAARGMVNLADPLTDGELVLVPHTRTTAGEARVDVNAASAEELQRLPGIGPVTAARIVAGRPYRSVDDLLGVRGIGPKTLERLAPLVGL